MSYRQLDVCSQEELFQNLRTKLQDNFDEIQVILERWCGLRNCPPKVFKLAYVELAEKEILKVVSSLDGEFELIKNLNAVILPGYTVSCYPDEGSKAKYFAVFSDMWTRPRTGQIYTMTTEKTEDIDTMIYDLYDLQADLGSAFTEDDEWLQVVQRSQKEGWSRCLLDLLTWHIEVKSPNYDARLLNLRVQVETVKDMGVLPFSLDSKGLVEEPGADEDFVGTRNGKLGQLPVWIKYFKKVPQQVGEQGQTAQEKALEAVLEHRNLAHPNILCWSAVCSSDPDKWTLVSPRIEQDLATMIKTHRGDGFKLTAITHIAVGLDYLHVKETWHGELSLANVLVSGTTSANRRFLLTNFGLRSFEGLPNVDYQDDADRTVTRPGRVVKDIEDFARIMYDIYPRKVAFNALKLTYADWTTYREDEPADLALLGTLEASDHSAAFNLSGCARFINRHLPIQDPEPCESKPPLEPEPRHSLRLPPSLDPCKAERKAIIVQANNLAYNVDPTFSKKYEKVQKSTPARGNKGNGIGGRVKKLFGLGRQPRLEVRIEA